MGGREREREIERGIERDIEQGTEREAGRLGGELRSGYIGHERADIPSWLHSTPTPCLHFKLDLIQTCCSWKEAISTGSNRKMIHEGI